MVSANMIIHKISQIVDEFASNAFDFNFKYDGKIKKIIVLKEKMQMLLFCKEKLHDIIGVSYDPVFKCRYIVNEANARSDYLYKGS